MGVVMLFGKKYDGHYAPFVKDGEVKGALFSGIPK